MKVRNVYFAVDSIPDHSSYNLGEEERHRLDVAALREKDPEFYKYLEENDRGLLEFGDDEADGLDGDINEQDAPKSTKNGKAKVEEPKVTAVTKDLLKSWQKQMLQVD